MADAFPRREPVLVEGLSFTLVSARPGEPRSGRALVVQWSERGPLGPGSAAQAVAVASVAATSMGDLARRLVEALSQPEQHRPAARESLRGCAVMVLGDVAAPGAPSIRSFAASGALDTPERRRWLLEVLGV